MDRPRQNLPAALLMVFSMAVFAVEDLFLKWSATELSPGQVIAMTGAAGAVIFALLTWARGHRVLTRQFFAPPVLIRNLSEAVASMLYVAALALIPLSINAALLQASPLVTTMGAALFLGETVGWRRWSAIGVGFAGVLVILRPGAEGFALAGLLTVGCVVVLAARDLATRAMPANIHTLQLVTWAYAAIVPAGLLQMAVMGSPVIFPQGGQWGLLAVALVSGIVGYYAVTAALRLGEVAVVTPFRYTRLIFSVALAMLFLGERPDGWTIAGSALIIGSGLYTFFRETRLGRRRAKAFQNV